jgi:hypothetical protein
MVDGTGSLAAGSVSAPARKKATSGWLVRVTTPASRGAKPIARGFWVGEEEKAAAEELVRDLSLPIARIEAIKPLFMSELESFGVEYRQVKAADRLPERP